MQILNKITMRSIVGSDVKDLLSSKEHVEFVLIVGWAFAETKGDRPTQFGDNVWIDGNFKARNLITNEVFQSTKLYAPENMHKLIAAEIHNAGPDPKVQFAFVVGVKKSKAPIGYEYSLRSLMEPKEDNDPFATIEKQIAPDLVRLVGTSTPNNNPGGITDPADIKI